MIAICYRIDYTILGFLQMIEINNVKDMIRKKDRCG